MYSEVNTTGWFNYVSESAEKLVPENCGKWMHFFDNQDYAKDICKKAMDEEICYRCKCSDLSVQGATGVICFYCNGDDLDGHKRIIEFMLRNGLIRKTKTGRLYNNSFKFNNQTLAGEYGTNFEGKIKLSDYIDLNTGAWLH